MSTEPTLPQGGQEQRRSQAMSLHREQPPTDVPGYVPERFLGVGAYGEVWVAVERNTGRRVAIKFYTHRGGLDWSLLSREVEKLAFLFADRYVVQLIGVGWEAEPPYYIMEYLEHGSLGERLQAGPLPVGQAVELFRDVAVGLVHSHGKGVLHCDLKPANILLDQDNKPRLADFGQSRLSHEQVPALGTLFYMAPEQADLSAVPEARWDVYALGALLYCMLTGSPPYRTEEAAEQLERTGDLQQRLSLYRRLLRHAPPPAAHRQVPGVDRQLAEIVDRCLAIDPDQRYPNVQAVLDALDYRAARRARRPMMVLGAVGPALVLLVAALFAWRGFSAAVGRSNDELTARALENNGLMAGYVAGLASKELARRFDAVEQMARSEGLKVLARMGSRSDLAALRAGSSPEMGKLLREVEQSELPELFARLGASKGADGDGEALRRRFLENPARLKLEEEFSRLIPPWMAPISAGGRGGNVASWFFCDRSGLSTFRVSYLSTSAEPRSEEKEQEERLRQRTIGRNYAWRSFFHGGSRDFEESWRPAPGQHLTGARLSAVFRSQDNGLWIVAVSAPVMDGKEFLGVVALTVRVDRFVELKGNDKQFAVLAELRDGEYTGTILQHPLYDALQAADRRLEERFQHYRLAEEDLPGEANPPRQYDYRDPMARDPEGQRYDRHWLAQMEPVRLHDAQTGWVVIVQEAYDTAIGRPLADLKGRLIGYGLAALGMFALVLLGLWWLAARMLQESGPGRAAVAAHGATERGTVLPTPEAATQTHRAARDGR